jgi:endonuclease V-like protein UPF0215 family
MTKNLIVKREIRALGLDLCDPQRLTGAVTRGGNYLDGILVLPSKPTLKTMSIASAIRNSRFFPELRLIMTHDPETQLDPNVIERSTKLPVIQVSATKKTQSEGFELYKAGRKQLLVRSSLPPSILKEILSTTWTIGMLPEPLRIAHLLPSSRFCAKNARFQANK